MRSLLVVATVAFFAVAEGQRTTWRQLKGYSFDKYCDEFGRSYEGQEFIRRKNIFDINLQAIQAHNADKSQTYKKGVNQFTDWTQAEFNGINRLKVDKTARAQAKYTHSMPTGANLPSEVDYRTWTSPNVLTGIKNQGACGGCWAFSATESVESYFALATGQLPVLSVQQITSCTEGGMQGCGGGDMSYGWKYVENNSTGLNEEWLYPFTDFFVAAETKAATAKCRNITKSFLPNFPWYPKAGVAGFGNVAVNDANATLHALARIGPQSISVAAASWSAYEGGIFQNDYSLGNNTVWQIDHGVQLVGYGHDFGMDMDYWIVRNSWGTQWGEDGFIRLSRPKVEPCGTTEYDNGMVCGTSGVLSGPDHPIVTELKKKN